MNASKDCPTEPVVVSGQVHCLVVRMSPLTVHWSASSIRAQLEKAFPGVPIVFVDQGTTIEVLHADH